MEDLDDLVLGADGDDATTGDEDEEAEDGSRGIPSLSGTVDEEDDDDETWIGSLLPFLLQHPTGWKCLFPKN